MCLCALPSFRQLQIGDYWAECPQLTTASQGESYSVRCRQQIPEVVPIYTDRREAEIPHNPPPLLNTDSLIDHLFFSITGKEKPEKTIRFNRLYLGHRVNLQQTFTIQQRHSHTGQLMALGDCNKTRHT